MFSVKRIIFAANIPFKCLFAQLGFLFLWTRNASVPGRSAAGRFTDFSFCLLRTRNAFIPSRFATFRTADFSSVFFRKFSAKIGIFLALHSFRLVRAFSAGQLLTNFFLGWFGTRNAAIPSRPAKIWIFFTGFGFGDVRSVFFGKGRRFFVKVWFTHFFASFFRVLEMFYSAYGFVVAVRINGMEEINPILLALGDNIGRDVFFNDPPVPISFPAETLNFFVDELFAAFVLTNARCDLLTCDAYVIHIGYSAPNHVNIEVNVDSLTFGAGFAIIHVGTPFCGFVVCFVQSHFNRREKFLSRQLNFFKGVKKFVRRMEKIYFARKYRRHVRRRNHWWSLRKNCFLVHVRYPHAAAWAPPRESWFLKFLHQFIGRRVWIICRRQGSRCANYRLWLIPQCVPRFPDYGYGCFYFVEANQQIYAGTAAARTRPAQMPVLPWGCCWRRDQVPALRVRYQRQIISRHKKIFAPLKFREAIFFWPWWFYFLINFVPLIL